MNIEGLSIKTIEALNDIGILNNCSDIYRLKNHKDKILKIDKFGEKKYKNLIESIDKSRNCYLHNFLYAIGIPNVGKGTAKDLSEYCSKGELNALDALSNMITEYDLNFYKSIPDIGEVVANSIYNYFNKDLDIIYFKDLLDEIEFREYKDDAKSKEIKDNKLNGKIVYPTGKFGMNKSELKAKIEGLGATISSGYKKSLDYLIVGGDVSKSGKVDKAIKDNVKLMSEDELMELLK